MSMLWRVVLLVAVLSKGIPVVAQVPEGKPLDERLKVRVGNYAISERTLVQALARVAAEFEIPLGIEWIREPQALQKIDLHVRNVSVVQILKSVLREYPGYQMEVRNEVVHVFYARARREKSNLLNLPIGEFQVRDEAAMLASYRLQYSVRQLMGKAMRPELGVGCAGSTAGLGARPVSISIRNSDVRQVLDELVLSAGFRLWVVTYRSRESFLECGFRQTVSLFNENVAKESQPVWDFLPAGYDPIAKTIRADWQPKKRGK